jgi:hypothetical protein
MHACLGWPHPDAGRHPHRIVGMQKQKLQPSSDEILGIFPRSRYEHIDIHDLFIGASHGIGVASSSCI